MTARDLPGPGDGATWGFRHPLDDDDEGRAERLEADLDTASEWLDTFEIAVKARDIARAEQSRAFLASILKSIQTEHLQ